MSDPAVDDLLTEIERVSREALEAGNDVEQGAWERVGEFVAQRGRLIGQLNTAILNSCPLSYIEFNRMLAIHRQGCQIEANLEKRRAALRAAMASAERQAAFADCISRILAPAVERHQIEI